MSSVSSRERMLQSINLMEPDHIPCALMSFTAMRRRVNEDMYALAKAELDLGLDSFLFIPSLGRPLRPEHPELRGLPLHFHQDVETIEWQGTGQYKRTILHKRYRTPAGELTTSVRLSEDWPHGDHIPFIDDFQVSRALKPLITEQSDLEALQFLFTPPLPEDIRVYAQEVERAHAFVKENGLLLVGGWGVGMDMANWLCGVQNLMTLNMTDESFIQDLLEMIHRWNLERMKVVLEGKVDLYIRRAWYEGCDFVTPSFYNKVILPGLKREVELAHEYGAKFGYICSSGLEPMLDHFLEAGIDVLIGVDPVQGTYSRLAVIKEKLRERVCLWGGFSGAVTIEMGTENEVRAAVRQAIEQLGPTGLILSPIDNITVDEPRTWQNLDTMMDEWKRSW